MSKDITPELFIIPEILKVFSYDPITGAIFKKGYGTIISDSKSVKVGTRRIHKLRLAYALYFGHWPRFDVLPADGDYCNTKLSNLREQVPRPRVLALSTLPKNIKKIDDLDEYLERRFQK